MMDKTEFGKWKVQQRTRTVRGIVHGSQVQGVSESDAVRKDNEELLSVLHGCHWDGRTGGLLEPATCMRAKRVEVADSRHHGV